MTAGNMQTSIGLELVPVPAGSFFMGSPPEEWGRFDTESQHEIHIANAFLIGCCPVTQREWRSLMQSDPSHFRGDDLPVEQITWFEAEEFCQRLSERENRRCRLPTEAEWEYACRAGATTAFWHGDTITADDANYLGSQKYGRQGTKSLNRKTTTPTRQFKPNPWGLFDLHGNVRQWCSDWMGKPPRPGGVSPGLKVQRGGAWNLAPRYGRCANRAAMPPDSRWPTHGLRVVMEMK